MAMIDGIIQPFITFLGVVELGLMGGTVYYSFKAVWNLFSGVRVPKDALSAMGKGLKNKDDKIRGYNDLANRLDAVIDRKDIERSTKLQEIRKLLEELKTLDEQYRGPA